MRQARVRRARGTAIRWTEVAGEEPARVYVHGLGSASTVYYAHIAARPELAGRRSLFVDLPGHGISDRPAELRLHPKGPCRRAGGGARRGGASPARNSSRTVWAAPSPSCSRTGGPTSSHDWSSPRPTSIRTLPSTAGSSGIASYEEDDYVNVAATRACWRKSALSGRRPCGSPTRSPSTAPRPDSSAGSKPTMRRMLEGWRKSTGSISRAPSAVNSRAGKPWRHAGVRVVTVPGAGHNIMFDNPDRLRRRGRRAVLRPDGDGLSKRWLGDTPTSQATS
jgi:pimeloyl-ACP methyl ester carboxylesterase